MPRSMLPCCNSLSSSNGKSAHQAGLSWSRAAVPESSSEHSIMLVGACEYVDAASLGHAVLLGPG